MSGPVPLHAQERGLTAAPPLSLAVLTTASQARHWSLDIFFAAERANIKPGSTLSSREAAKQISPGALALGSVKANFALKEATDVQSVVCQ